MARKLDSKQSFDVFGGLARYDLEREAGFFGDKASDGFDIFWLVFHEAPDRGAVALGVMLMKGGWDEEGSVGFEKDFFNRGEGNAGVSRDAVYADIKTVIETLFQINFRIGERVDDAFEMSFREFVQNSKEIVEGFADVEREGKVVLFREI